MSRSTGYQDVSAAVMSAIKLAWPDARAKRIAAALGCSVITGKRIASTGRVSERFRAALISVLQDAIARNKAQLDRLDDELRAIEYEEMVARADARRAESVRSPAAEPSQADLWA